MLNNIQYYFHILCGTDFFADRSSLDEVNNLYLFRFIYFRFFKIFVNMINLKLI